MAPKTRSGARIEPLFVTEIYRAKLPRPARLNAELEAACRSIAAEDAAGQRWCAAHDYKGYTSYASLDDLPWRASVFAELVTQLDAHVQSFARALEFDLDARRLKLDSPVAQRPEAGRAAHGPHPSPLGHQRYLLRRRARRRRRHPL